MLRQTEINVSKSLNIVTNCNNLTEEGKDEEQPFYQQFAWASVSICPKGRIKISLSKLRTVIRSTSKVNGDTITAQEWHFPMQMNYIQRTEHHDASVGSNLSNIFVLWCHLRQHSWLCLYCICQGWKQIRLITRATSLLILHHQRMTITSKSCCDHKSYLLSILLTFSYHMTYTSISLICMHALYECCPDFYKYMLPLWNDPTHFLINSMTACNPLLG